MTPERWQHVKALFESALEVDASRRNAFLDRACSGDSSLRQEVESLLHSHSQASQFLEPASLEEECLAGQSIGHYEVLRLIGKGGMGEVYVARDKRLGRFVALKFLPASVQNDSDRRARLLIEAQAASLLHSPYIAAIYDIGEENGRAYIVMEYVDGELLSVKVKSGSLPINSAIDWAIQTAEALDEAHGNGIIHRDIKPSNLMITRRGHVKVLDFGLAKVAQPTREEVSETLDLKTEPGTVMGTVHYMSPEQARGLPVDGRSDLFSLGVVLYKMLTGRLPFDGQTTTDVLAAILGHEPEPPAHRRPEIPNDLEGILRRCLEKDRERRYRVASEVAADLKRVRDGDSLETAVVDVKSRSLAPSLTAGVSVAVIPFNDIADVNMQYLSEGISEGLTGRLARIPRLRVAPWTMVLRLKPLWQDFAGIAKDLGVRTLLILRLVVHGDTYQVRAEWLDPERKAHLWGGRYGHDLAGSYSFEDEIALDFTGQFAPQMSTAEMAKIRKQHTHNGRAYQLYLKGRHLWNKRTSGALIKAIQYYRQALDQDAGFALAFAGIADSYLTLGTFGFLSPEDSLPAAKAAADRALEIDDSLGEARATRAAIRAFYDWDWTGAESEFREAMVLAPQYSIAPQWYGGWLCALGRFAAGSKLLRSALELDPLSPMIAAQLAAGYYLERRYHDGVRVCAGVLDTDGQFWAALLFLGLCHEQMGQPEDAILRFRAAAEQSADGPMAVAALAHALARTGDHEAAIQLLTHLTVRSSTEYIPPYSLALINCGLSRHDVALKYLERAYEERSPAIALWLRGEPRLDPLRLEPRFQALLRSAHLI